jgi:hypothetical protein
VAAGERNDPPVALRGVTPSSRTVEYHLRKVFTKLDSALNGRGSHSP